MRILVTVLLVAVLGCVLVWLNWDRLRQFKHYVLNREWERRSAADSVTPKIKDPGRHQQFLERIKQGEKIGVLFIGDSITDWWPQVGQKSWLQLSKYDPANFGIGGDRTENVLWRVQNGELEGIDPKVVVLLIGTNNLGTVHGERPEWVANGVGAILREIRSRLPQTKVLLLGIFPRDGHEQPMRERIRRANEQIAKLADGKNVMFADYGAAFVGPAGELDPEIMPDGLHLTAKGYDIWYRQLEPQLAQLMATPDSG